MRKTLDQLNAEYCKPVASIDEYNAVLNKYNQEAWDIQHVHELWFKEEITASKARELTRAIMASKLSCSEALPDWIEVKKKLPDADKWVLVCNEYWVGVGKYVPHEDKEDSYPEWQDETTQYIPVPIAWKSLPNNPYFKK